jgi:uncharacterized protein (TIGR04255 family)
MAVMEQFNPIIFDNPPIAEKVMGVEFTPLETWFAPHFGLFWHEIRKDYPNFEMKPPIINTNM